MMPTLRLLSLTTALLSLALTVIALPAPCPGPCASASASEVAHLYRRNVQHHLQNHAHTHVENAHGDHETWKGHVTAHIGDNAHNTQISPAQLRQYAAHVHGHIMAHNPGISPHFIVAATHHRGDNVVHFHTQPKGASHAAHQNKNFHNMAHAMADHGLAKRKADGTVHDFWHHAETAAIRHSMEARGADHTNAHLKVQHHAVGVHGFLPDGHGGHNHINHPCQKCQGTLHALGVAH